jgi:hypothetical protein
MYEDDEPGRENARTLIWGIVGVLRVFSDFCWALLGAIRFAICHVTLPLIR